MKKIILGIILIFSSALVSLAQPVATTGRVEMQKGYKNSATIELPFTPDVVEGALKDQMLKNGIKADVSKGFLVFKGARMSATDGEVADLYFKVDRKSRKDNNAVVNLVVGRPNENVALRTAEESYRIEDAEAFLNNMIPFVEAYNLEVQITEQANVINKQEKKLNNLMDDQKSLEKKIQNFQDKLESVNKDIEAQKAELEKQRGIRESMQARRVAQ